MSDTIFFADYSNCEDANREVNSNINYIDAIYDIIDDMDEYIDEIGPELWARSKYDGKVKKLRAKLQQEKDRYGTFYEAFKEFYSSLEDIDASMNALFTNSVNYIEKEGSYELYLAIIETDINSDLKDGMYEMLLELGLSEEEAMLIQTECSSEMVDLLSKLSTLSDEELEAYVKEIAQKEDKSLLDVALYDILSVDDPGSYMDTISGLLDDIAEGKWDKLLLRHKIQQDAIDKIGRNCLSTEAEIKAIQKKLSSDKLSDISRQNLLSKIEKLKAKLETSVERNGGSGLDCKSARLAKLKQKLKGGKLTAEQVSKVEAEVLEIETMRANSVANRLKAQKIKNISTKVGKVAAKALKYLAIAYELKEIGIEEYDEITKNGKELDDAALSASLDIGALALGMWTGGKAGAAIGTAIGGPVGAGVGFVSGVIIGGGTQAAANWASKYVEEAYDEYVEPEIQEGLDELNDLGDWWDSLWW